MSTFSWPPSLNLNMDSVMLTVKSNRPGMPQGEALAFMKRFIPWLDSEYVIDSTWHDESSVHFIHPILDLTIRDEWGMFDEKIVRKRFELGFVSANPSVHAMAISDLLRGAGYYFSASFRSDGAWQISVPSLFLDFTIIIKPENLSS